MNETVKIFQPSLEPWDGKDPDKTIAVMMSGGVDSSVTASLLLEQGWNVIGVTMKIPKANCNIESPCCGDEAIFVSAKLGIPHYFIDTTEVFNKYVIEHFRTSYLSGKTPNPCTECNSILKFGILWDSIEKEMGITNFATGHYANIIRTENEAFLARGNDLKRDQSYFIYGIKREKLFHFHLPLGDTEKVIVRKIAAEKDLHVAERPDSMDLCFAGEGDYREVLGDKAVSNPGPVYDMQGNVMAEHTGIWNYTIGQRRGLGFAAGEPRYVLEINPEQNSITVGTRDEAYKDEVSAEKPNILITEKYKAGSKLNAKIRSLSPLKECIITKAEEDTFTIKFTQPQFGPTPGQHAVLYDERDYVVAGGVIV